MAVRFTCSSCGGRLHHSRLKTWYERVWWRATGRVPWRCQQCNRRSWDHDDSEMATEGVRDVRPDLTDGELDTLDRDDV